MGEFFTSLLAKFAAVANWFGGLFVAMFVALWDMVTDAFSWVFDQMLSVAVSAISGIDVSGLSAVNSWGSLPGELINILGLLGVGQAVGIITTAIGIRFALQLIPFVRLGS